MLAPVLCVSSDLFIAYCSLSTKAIGSYLRENEPSDRWELHLGSGSQHIGVRRPAWRAVVLALAVLVPTLIAMAVASAMLIDGGTNTFEFVVVASVGVLVVFDAIVQLLPVLFLSDGSRDGAPEDPPLSIRLRVIEGGAEGRSEHAA